MAGPHVAWLRRRSTLALLVGAVLGEAATAADPGVLRIETIQSAPFGMIDAHGVSSGMTYEMGNLIAERAGLRPINRVVPYARTVVSLREGSADVVIRFNNDELGLVAIQLGKVVPLRMALLSLAARPVTEFGDLIGETVAVARSAPLNLHTQESFLHLSRKTATPALIAALRASLESVMRDGSLEQIRRRYEQDTPEAIDPRR